MVWGANVYAAIAAQQMVSYLDTAIALVQSRMQQNLGSQVNQLGGFGGNSNPQQQALQDARIKQNTAIDTILQTELKTLQAKRETFVKQQETAEKQAAKASDSEFGNKFSGTA